MSRQFELKIYPQYESTESRLARGDWRSRRVGYRCIVRPGNRPTSIEFIVYGLEVSISTVSSMARTLADEVWGES